MIVGGVGGANTKTGLVFEKDTDLKQALHGIERIKIVGHDVYENGEKVGLILQKHNLYTQLLEARGVDWRSIVSKKLLPDEAYFALKTNTVIVIEKKFQQVAGSVDEKLQTCDFKRKQYEKLLSPLNINVEYVYVLNDWFLDKSYKDVLNYITESQCHYYFNTIPMHLLDLA